jgi:hypothetical protein
MKGRVGFGTRVCVVAAAAETARRPLLLVAAIANRNAIYKAPTRMSFVTQATAQLHMAHTQNYEQKYQQNKAKQTTRQRRYST